MTLPNQKTAKPRIALVSHMSRPGRMTGAEKSLLALAGGLRGRGRDVVVVAPGEGMFADEARRAGLSLRVAPYPCLWWTGSGSISLREILHAARFAALLSLARRRLRRLFEEENIDLVHVNSAVNITPALAARDAGIPAVWNVREIFHDGWRRRFFARRLARLADRVVGVSHAVARALEGISDSRLRVIHNGAVPLEADAARVEAVRREWNLPEGKTLLWAGQFEQRKGLGHFLAALARLRSEGAEFRAVVMGGGGGREGKFREAAAAAGIADAVAWAGFQRDMAPFYAAADALLFTSPEDDPFPRVILEAMAAGIPVAAYRGGGVDELVEDGATGILVERGSVTALAQAVRTLLHDEARRRRMGDAARGRVGRYLSFEAMLDAYEAVYREILA